MGVELYETETMMETEKVAAPIWFGIATVILLLAKAGGLNISWLWVFAPIWAPYGVIIGFLLVYYASSAAWGIVRRRKTKPVQQRANDAPRFHAESGAGAIGSALSRR